jgi:hypothetical protein
MWDTNSFVGSPTAAAADRNSFKYTALVTPMSVAVDHVAPIAGLANDHGVVLLESL